VSEAAGMVAAQAGCSTGEALALLRARAEQTDSDLEDIALAVAARRVSFAPTGVGQFGSNCAALLVAMDLPHDMVVRCLMNDLDLTREEAAVAARTAQAKQLTTSGAGSARPRARHSQLPDN
jgi:hypothetical protein